MNATATPPVSTISAKKALRLFMAGELVTAHDMEYRLRLDSHYLLSEKEMLNPKHSLRIERGFPVVKVEGMEGTFFSPAAVILFMDVICDDGEDDEDEEMAIA